MYLIGFRAIRTYTVDSNKLSESTVNVVIMVIIL